jgi:Cu(I)/Ag(I) efflux system membrane fusion protein
MESIVKSIVGIVGLLLLAAAPFAASDPLEPIAEPYLRIHAALAADKTDGVGAEARRIAERAAQIDDGTAIAAAAKKLAAAADLKGARAAFGELSEAMIERVKGKPEGDLKVAYCPMAGRSWLQKGKEIQNPYYGAVMLGCGEFKSRTSP